MVSTVKLFIHEFCAFLDCSNHKQFFLVKAFASITSAPPLEKTWLRACSKRRESLCPAFPTFSAGSERRESLRPAFPIFLHLVLALYVGKVFALFSYFPTFSAGSKRREILRPAFPIYLHLVLAINIGKVFPCFPYI